MNFLWHFRSRSQTSRRDLTGIIMSPYWALLAPGTRPHLQHNGLAGHVACFILSLGDRPPIKHKHLFFDVRAIYSLLLRPVPLDHHVGVLFDPVQVRGYPGKDIRRSILATVGESWHGDPNLGCHIISLHHSHWSSIVSYACSPAG